MEEKLNMKIKKNWERKLGEKNTKIHTTVHCTVQ